ARFHLYTRFPYTTLFDLFSDEVRLRAVGRHERPVEAGDGSVEGERYVIPVSDDECVGARRRDFGGSRRRSGRDKIELQPARGVRSEEHTSELQSRENLVC